MTEWREFRPDKQLLQNNFDGYRLSLEPLAQYSLKFDENLQVQKDIQLDQEFYTYNGIKAFKSSNQLYLNPWKDTSDAYFFDQFHSIQQINLSSNESLSHLQQPINVYQLPKTTLNGSMIFITESMVVVGDGRSRLFILNSTNPKWKLLHEQDFDELINSPSRLLHAVYHQGTLHVLMGFIQKDCQLLWTSFSVGTANEIQLTRRRILNGKKWPDFYAFESNGQGIYITSEGLYKFTFDSLIEVKPEEPPKQPTLEKIESSLHYIWSQTHTTIDIEIDLTENIESQPCSVDIQVDHLKCSLNDTILVDAKLFDTIDPKESSYVITKDKNNQLTITLQKANVGSFWSEVFREGQAISGGIKMDNLPETNVDEDEDEMKQPYNNQQLEECDQYSNETDTFLVRIDGDTHRITHQALVNNQILFTQLNPPLLCIRNDVDGLIWRLNSLASNDQAPWFHEATLNAFGYVQASKRNRKFISTPEDYSYALICDMQTHLYLYKQNSPASTLPGSSLRNRKTGKLVESIAKQHMISLENHEEILGLQTRNDRIYILTNQPFLLLSLMEGGQLNIEKLTQVLTQQTFPASVDATLIAIRECSMFTRKDLSLLANRFIFCHSQISGQWKKTLNNIQELHTLDILRQFFDNQTDINTSMRVFDIIFFDILVDQDHPLFALYYNIIVKFLSLVISFESKVTLTILTRCLFALSKTTDLLIGKIIDYIINEHIALAMTKSINHLCSISPLFTLCFINQTCLLLDQEKLTVDTKTLQTLIELLTFGVTNSTNLLLITLQQELLAENTSSFFNFVPAMVRLDVLFPFRSLSSSSLSLHLDHFHTSILSFLFSIVIDKQNQILQKHLFIPNYFEQLSIVIQESISHHSPTPDSLQQSIQRYLQLIAVCKTPSLPLTQISINDLAKSVPLFTHHRLFDILKEKEEQEMKKN